MRCCAGSSRRAADRLAPYGWSNSLAAKLLQLAGPGVPDVYQGSELWETSLADPDNRRPVDFALRRRLLAELDAGGLLPPIDETGAVKLLVTARALRLRRARPELFTRYTPMTVVGEASGHAIAFDRGGVVAVATRLPLGLERRGGWGQAALLRHPGPTVDVLTGRRYAGTELALRDLLVRLPRGAARPGGGRVIEVWAPRAARVRVRRPGVADVDLTAGADGWWSAPLVLADGDEYGFVLDDAAVTRPDPRSRRQPAGVHAASVHHDPTAFPWTDRDWTGRQLAGGLIYELHVGTFTPEGTLDAAVERFPHLLDLGITHVELLPVNAFNGEWNWGYDGVLWYAVHEQYGGPAAYQRFVDAAHSQGLAVIQDVVYNHLGPSGNYLPEFGPYLRDAQRNTWGLSVNLDEPAVRSFIVDNALMWLRDYHVDGLRLDAVHALHDSAPVHILQELAEASDALSAELDRPLSLIAESDLNDPTLILPREAGGYGLAAQWNDDYHHAVHVAVTGETTGYYTDFAPLSALAKVWTQGFFHDGTWSSFRGRDHGRPIDPRVPTWRLVTFGQDHDQIGNRAAGDRLSQTLDDRSLQLAAALTLLTPYTPMLFMGEEWAASTPWQFFTSHPEPWLATATAEGRIEEFARMGWDRALVPDPQDPETFRRSKLRWDEIGDGRHARTARRLPRARGPAPQRAGPDRSRLRARPRRRGRAAALGAPRPRRPRDRAQPRRGAAVDPGGRRRSARVGDGCRAHDDSRRVGHARRPVGRRAAGRACADDVGVISAASLSRRRGTSGR